MSLLNRHFAGRRFAALVCTFGAAGLVGGWLPATVRADLTWKEETLEFKPEAKASTIEARFQFNNGGTTPVDVTQIQPSCGCTTVELEKRHYEPGQGGEIVVNYTIGDHVGVQRKSILVTSSDHLEPTILTIVARVPEPLKLVQTSVIWKSGEPAKAKVIQINVPPEVPKPDEISVTSSNSSVSAVLQPVDEGRGYDLLVTPAATDKPAFATLLIRCRLGTEEKTFRAYATIERGEPAPRAPVVSTEPLPPVPPADKR